MKKGLLIIIGVILIMSVTGCTKTNSNIEDYLQTGTEIDSHSKSVMPILENLEDYNTLEYLHTRKSSLIFESNSFVLVVQYDDETYLQEKEKLAKEYLFLDHVVKSNFDATKYVIPENQFSINTYVFNVVDEDKSAVTDYPKSFGIIGTSDDKKSIAYLYFYDPDLDSIADENEENPMKDFVSQFFKYAF
ncbi:hypothetical protein ACR6HW_01775 [Fusibacter sp. JL298sf-3]